MTTPTALRADLAPPVTGQAVVFAGQGSQRPGMALAWRGDPAFGLWAQADELLGRDVTRLGTTAPAAELRLPANCQVALYVHAAVTYAAWQREGGTAVVFAGHSLGEYNALQAAGVLSFADGLRLVDQRARATQEAADANPGGMLAIIGGDSDVLRELCQRSGAAIGNDNAPGQLVVSGTDAALTAFTEAADGSGAKIIRLEVGAAYHSPLMEPAVGPLDAALAATHFADAVAPVIANVDARPHDRGADWPALLRAQLTAGVRWRETLERIAASADALVELSASPVLTGMAKRVAPQLARRTITTPEQIDAA